MRQELTDLHALLQEQKTLQQELLDLSHEKRQVVMQGDAARLAELSALEQRGVTRLKNLSKRLARLLPELAAFLGIPEEEVSLSQVMKRLEAGEHETFARLQKELTGLYHAQTEINQVNRQLLEAHLEYADAMLGILVSDEDPLNNFYGDDGKMPDERKKVTGLFDRQI